MWWWLWPLQYESFSETIEPAAPVLACIYVAVFLYSLYACLRHANGDRYEGAHPIIWSIVLLSGHIFAVTIYHFLVVLRR